MDILSLSKSIDTTPILIFPKEYTNENVHSFMIGEIFDEDEAQTIAEKIEDTIMINVSPMSMILVTDIVSNQVLETCRKRARTQTNKFYSSKEKNITNLTDHTGETLIKINIRDDLVPNTLRLIPAESSITRSTSASASASASARSFLDKSSMTKSNISDQSDPLLKILERIQSSFGIDNKIRDDEQNLDPESMWTRTFITCRDDQVSTNVSEFAKFLVSPLNMKPRFVDIECSLFENNPEEYARRKAIVVRHILGTCDSLRAYTMGRLLVEMYRMIFVSTRLGSIESNRKGQIFYEFFGNRWNPRDEIDVKMKIIDDFYHRILQILYHPPFPTYEDQRDHIASVKVSEKEISLVTRIRNLLWDDHHCNRIFDMFSKAIYNSNFVERLDIRHDLIAFDNGVYDLGRKCFREGRQSDYISRSCGYDLRDVEALEDEEVLKILETIFPQRDVLDYMMRFLASCLRGGNRDKIFCVWTGPGDNGKSFFVTLTERMFGEYAIKAPTSLLTGKRGNSSSATPELALLDGKRITFVQEPDGNDKLNVGMMKELTGNDRIYVRGLYQGGKNVSISTKIVLVANKIPSILETDRATWTRIRVIPFVSTFVGEDEFKSLSEKQEHVFLRDPNITSKISWMAPVLMRMLTKEYERYENLGLHEPPAVVEMTKELRKTNDIVGEFLELYTEQDEDSRCQPDILYERYKTWLKTVYPRTGLLELKGFVKEIKKHDLYQDINGRLIGLRLKEDM
jgi:P4 family phage/plasmid primase-like protien